jgi:hypothetical protein
MCFHASAVAENPEFAGAQDQGSSSEGSSVRRESEWLLLHDLIVIRRSCFCVHTRKRNDRTELRCVCRAARSTMRGSAPPVRLSRLSRVSKSLLTLDRTVDPRTLVSCVSASAASSSRPGTTHTSRTRAPASRIRHGLSPPKSAYTRTYPHHHKHQPHWPSFAARMYG